ncbi:thermonuclease family protein [Magnetospirillum fulvum]|uniref:Micrococcal nuclease-like protein n=1 Tax=Magnetospirillum fulvum MGU-K5 TaxID=1316936 RepID=S9S4X6_MAGFU|nr:micrococcal nuclease-like protein [Magnetospirillum fulvum]EPY00982.1 micrococcal nuclease-like protein [Magnetospirillum fulvum MGU-K5]
MRVSLAIVLSALLAVPVWAAPAPPASAQSQTAASVPSAALPPVAAPSPPSLPRCAEDSEGAACVWGRVEGFDAGSIQLHGLSIELVGITVPGRKDLCGNRVSREDFDCARPTRKKMADLVRGGVACEIVDVASGQLWGRCHTLDGDLGRLLILAGVARAAKDGPYEEPQLQAINAKRGLWAPEIILPRDWDAAKRKATDN